MHFADAFAFCGRAACRNARLSLAGRLSRRICFLRVRQGIAQFLACSMQARADGRGFAMCELGDLFGRVTFDAVQVDGEPPCFRQLLHRLPNGVFRQGGKGVRFGIIGGILVYDSFERRPLLVGSDHRTPPPSGAANLEAAVDRHAQKPRLQVPVINEIRLVTQQPQEHVLGHVLRIVGRARLVEREPIDRRPVRVHRALHELRRSRGLWNGLESPFCGRRGIGF